MPFLAFSPLPRVRYTPLCKMPYSPPLSTNLGDSLPELTLPFAGLTVLLQ